MATNAFVELPPLKEAQTLADYTGVHHDLFSAREFATMLLEEYRQQNFRLADPLMVAIIIRYARSFKGGIRSRLPNAENVLTNGQLARHQYFLDVRDKFIAHSVNAFEECQPVARYWVESVESEGISSIECNYHRISGLSEDDLTGIIDLINTWLAYIKQLLTKEKTKILEMVRKMPLEKILRGEKGPPVLDTSQPKLSRQRFS